MKRLALSLVVAAFVAACGGGGDDSDSGEFVGLPEGTVSAERAADIVSSFDPGEEQAIADLNDVVSRGGDEVVPAVAPLLEDEDPNKRWAALHVVGALTDTADEIALLQPMLQDDDPILRVMAAGSLAGGGVVEALPVLAEGLSSEEDVPFSDPPRPVSAHVQFALEQYTGEVFNDASEWEAWWGDAGDSIRWEDGRYVVD